MDLLRLMALLVETCPLMRPRMRTQYWTPSALSKRTHKQRQTRNRGARILPPLRWSSDRRLLATIATNVTTPSSTGSLVNCPKHESSFLSPSGISAQRQRRGGSHDARTGRRARRPANPLTDARVARSRHRFTFIRWARRRR
ncbi:hypothetical protein EVAR_8404_1 [Eumeta japonica]|uniref:Uncharacterized protein n=1 Tax=Eumeta variegata TaxID=151549 RepID=A0A4C1WBN7_EUMVA|nr:hypothetical protein EVAR_8404_1 [Eumeta japonica]